jgi:hypothetical protein
MLRRAPMTWKTWTIVVVTAIPLGIGLSFGLQAAGVPKQARTPICAVIGLAVGCCITLNRWRWER